MERIKLHDKTFKPYMRESEVLSAIDDVAKSINADYKDSCQPPVILCVLNGAMMFTSELLKRLDFNCTVASLKLTSYVGTRSTGAIQVPTAIHGDIRDKNVIVCEDIVDTGNTIEFLSQYLKDQGAREVRICTMLHKPDVYTKDIKLDYIGRCIPNDFIVGFGLDYDELGRNYRDIYVIDNE